MMDDSYQPKAWDLLEGVPAPAENLDLVGHNETMQGLVDKYRAGRLHHAWLVTGPRGIGKATMSFRFAEYMLRNPDHTTAAPSFTISEDAVHSQVAKGAHPNVLSLQRSWDLKQKKFRSGILVEDVRRLGSFLQTASGANAWRVIIVDPADDMNTSAANALLKMLEEPPARTLFLVLAHSPRGLLATIRSRCQMLVMKPLNDEQMRTVLASHASTAQLGTEESELLINRAGGSVRKALELVSSEVLETFEAFIGLVESRKEDIGRLHQLAGPLAAPGKAVQYRLFTDLLSDHMASQLRDKAANDQIPLDRLNRLVEAWERFQLNNSRAETWNMDRKQVVLSLYRDLRSAV